MKKQSSGPYKTSGGNGGYFLRKKLADNKPNPNKKSHPMVDYKGRDVKKK